MAFRHQTNKLLKIRNTGFTLIEVLVVMLIVGIIVSFATLSVRRGTDKAVEEEARRLAGLVELAGQEAVLQSRELALRLAPGGYEFQVFDRDQWRRVTADDTLRPRTLPDGVRLEINIEGEAVDLEKKSAMSKGEGDASKIEPRVYLLSSGEITPFQLVVFRAGKSGEGYRVKGDVAGKVVVEEVKR
ncbi:MAG: type II secretion system minor pseudopilin GspH [Pseudomonadota bacterium]